GHVMKVGYSPFSWGQISQLPQIYAGFDIPVIMFYRGINSLDSPKAEFIWEGADGTHALCSRFSTMPRYNFYFYIYRPVVHNEQPADIKSHWQRGGKPFHFANPAFIDEDYSLTKTPDHYYIENLKPAVERIIKDQLNDFTTRHIFWAEGHDTSGPNPITTKIIRDINQFIKDGVAIHSNLEDYAEALQKECQRNDLSLVTGERRSAQYDHRSGNLYGYTTSARMYLKQMNFESEKWLQYYAEPLNSIAGILGLDVSDKSLDLAWELLLQNSAHDSIGGCSLDEVHEDMVARNKQCNEISRSIIERACQYICREINLEHQLNLIVLNPLIFKRNEIIEAFIDIPKEVDLGHISISDSGQNLQLQVLNRSNKEPILESLTNRPLYYSMIRYHVLIDVNDIPACGFKTLHVHPVPQKSGSKQPINKTAQNSVLENEYLHISINSNGTLDITDKNTGKEFKNLGYFLDEGEAGHAWVHTSIGPTITTEDSRSSIRIIEDNALRKIVRVSNTIQIPKNLTERRKKRPQTCPLSFTVDVVLNQHSHYVQLRIDIENNSESHRLRIMFPMGIDAKYSYGEGQFDVVRRRIDRPNTSDWIEQPMYDYPMHHFVDLNNGKYGMALLVEGLKEYEVLNDNKQTLALTLLRSFEYRIPVASLQDFSHQKGSQCLGRHQYHIALCPHKKDWNDGSVFSQAFKFNYMPLSVQMGSGPGRLPSELSFLKLDSDQLVFSSFKVSEDHSGFILRIYNPTNIPAIGNIISHFEISDCMLTDLAENYVCKAPIINTNLIQLKIGPKKIVTIYLKFNNPPL
ncbi:MAG: hypothetical protein JXR87_02810, partial [Candidatus Marinimicrobia bacterium]|nr:hypothetical protein [Candidatus Neomarinimicrobiota bacterium]